MPASTSFTHLFPGFAGDPAALDAALAETLATARTAWPEVELAAETFVAYLAERLPREGDPIAALEALEADDLYLACACALHDARALAAFERRYVAEVPAYLARTAWARAADEVRQAVRERLFVAEPGRRPKIAEYSGKGPLGGWLRIVTLRTASNLHRGAKVTTPIEDAGAPPDLTAVEPELALLQARCGEAINGCIRDAFTQLSAEDRSLLRLHFLDGLGIDRLGLALGVHRATAARRLAAARERLLGETHRLARERLQVDAVELASLLGAVRSKLQVSLQAILREPGASGVAEPSQR